MKKWIISTLIALTVTSVIAQKKPKIKGDKNVITTSNVFENGFNAVEIDDDLEVILRQEEQNNYSLTADKNLHDIIKFTVKDSVLKIHTTNKIVSSKKLEINLSVSNLERISLKNDTKLKGEGILKSKVLHLDAYNSSKFKLDIEAKDIVVALQNNSGGELKVNSTNTTIVMTDRTDLKASVQAENTNVTLSKSAQLNLKGDSESVNFNLKDSSELDAKKLKSSFVDLITSNSSDVYIYAGKNLKLYAQGKSNIYLYGDPKIEVEGLNDKSKIIKKQL